MSMLCWWIYLSIGLLFGAFDFYYHRLVFDLLAEDSCGLFSASASGWFPSSPSPSMRPAPPDPRRDPLSPVS
jgi:hypothetical protein